MATDAGYHDTNLDHEETEEELEARARQMGWKGPEEFRPRRPGQRHVGAREFIARGEEELPVMRDNNRRMSEQMVRMQNELEQMRNTVAEQQQAVKDAMALARTANKAGYDRAMRELEAQRLQAVEAGDTVVFRQVQEQIDAMETTRVPDLPPAPSPSPPPAAQPQLPAEIVQFQRDNKWFAADPVLQRAMIDYHNQVIKESPTMILADQLDEALARVKAKFPKDFPADPGENQDEEPEVLDTRRPRLRSAAPDAAGERRPRQAASVIDRIADPDERKEARRAFESMKKQDASFTEAEYMALIDDPHADVLALRAARPKS